MSYPKDMNDYAYQAHQNSKAHGFWEGEDPTDPHVLAAKLCLIHSEVSEALECIRDGQMKTTLRQDGKPEGFPSELADIIIRVFDLAEVTGCNIQQEVVNKMEFNRTRTHRHGGRIL